MTKIAKDARKVSWTVSVEIGIGHEDCQGCGVATPSPDDDTVRAFAQTHPGQNFLWPGSRSDGWMPTGWTRKGDGLLCPECSAAVSETLKRMRANRER